MRGALLALTLVVIGTAHAGRPLSTEDASVLEEKRCQLETWIDRARDSSEAWFVPACNFGFGIEWQVGFARAREAGQSYSSQSYAQAKGLIKGIGDGSPWGIGWVVGVSRDPLRASRRGWQDPYALVPVSIAFGDALVHANVGWSRDRAERRDTTLWGIAAEVPGGERITWVAEAFGERASNPFLRAGARFSVVKDVLDLDLTAVNRPGGTREERFLSLGVFWQSGRLF